MTTRRSWRERGWRGWASPPLLVQILALLIGALVVAQLVTLLLTLVLPPEPPRRYEMGDIAAALRGERTARPLERHLQAGPPDLAARGWLVSATTTARLAKAMGVDADRVAFGFYTELPVGGAVGGLGGTPPPPQRLPADARPSRPGPPVAALARPRHRGAPQLPVLALAAAVPVDGGQEQAPPPRQPGFPTSPPPGAMPGSFPGGFPDAAPGGRRPPRGGLSPAGDRARRGGVPDVTVAHDPRTQQPAAVQLGHPTPQITTGEQRGAVNAGQAQRQPETPLAGQLPGDIGQGRRVDPDLPRADRPFAAMPLRPVAMPTAPAAATEERAPVTTRPAAPAAASRLVETGRPTAARPVPGPATAPAATAVPSPRAPAVTTTRAAAPTRPLAGPAQQPLPILRPATGLFGLAAAPFVEGDFVAAVRQPDGRWAVVTPAEEGFPNAWQRRVLLWFGLSLLAVTPIAWAFARRIVGPLQGFARAAEMLGRDPSAAILPLAGPAEVGRAAHAFNQMQSRLRSFVDDRTAMIGAISHDLRTPLTRLRFRIEDVPEEQHAGLLGEIEAMEAMISSVIAYMRDAATPGVRERRDMAELVGDVVEDAALIGGDVTTVRAEPAPVDIDALGIRRVLDNLLTNAIKYGGGTARVALTVEDACAVADIVDDGPGIPEAELERVFEPFYRSEAARASSREGSGLGLAVCRSIARAHGGDVRLFRSAQGFTARVTLPLAYDGERQLAA